MQSFEHTWAESATPMATPAPAEPIVVPESPTAAAARVLELAVVTADELVTDAEAEAASLLTTAQATADALVEASQDEADQVTAALARTKAQQAAALDHERTATLAGLKDEKAALEAQIATLREMEIDHRSQMRDHLTEHLSLLDASLPEPPTAIAG